MYRGFWRQLSRNKEDTVTAKELTKVRALFVGLEQRCMIQCEAPQL